MARKPRSTRSKAQRFRATRAHHSLEAAEDYTELIFDLIRSQGEARIGEIARQLGISHVTALRTIKRLKRDGYVKTTPKKPVELTRKGSDLAMFAKQRHAVLVDLFVLLGVPRNIAEIDAEGAEHHISEIALRKISSFMEKWRSRITAS